MNSEGNEMPEIESEPNTNRDAHLFQNYPNPFAVTTFISFTIPQTNGSSSAQQHVVLKIFDSEGNELSTLVNDTRSPGYYDVEFNSGRLPTGVYYYELIVGSYHREVKKMILLK